MCECVLCVRATEDAGNLLLVTFLSLVSPCLPCSHCDALHCVAPRLWELPLQSPVLPGPRCAWHRESTLCGAGSEVNSWAEGFTLWSPVPSRWLSAQGLRPCVAILSDPTRRSHMPPAGWAHPQASGSKNPHSRPVSPAAQPKGEALALALG